MSTIEFTYELKSVVTIKFIDTEAIVAGYYYSEGGVQYQVAYWLDGKRELVYLYPEEIKEFDAKKDIGGFLNNVS